MQRRIQRILLICSSYDAYMLEEDGRIDEQIFNEYVSLNLRRPPSFVHTDSAEKARAILASEPIDLVIEMLSIPDIDTFELANRIKADYPKIPIAVLTHFSREVSLRLKNEDLSAIDNIFCWLSNADLLVAIVKLFEDRMNAENDVQTVGVQTILLVEDSIRFTSTYLPDLYKIIFKQSQEFLKEGLNDHQRRLRMRGRPKILLANTYKEALLLYEKYKHNMLGIISDINIKNDKFSYEKVNGGVQLCRHAKEEDPFMPFVFQSSDIENRKIAEELGVGFIHKFSKTLSTDLKSFIVNNFGFGDFVFRDPATMNEIARASDLVSLQHHISAIPDESLIFHASRNEISKWLNARSLFPIAQMFKQLRIDDLGSVQNARNYLFKAISNYRLSRARGIIANFNRETFDEYHLFSRIGEGSIGGKARGLVFLGSIIKNNQIFSSFPHVNVRIPRTVVITTEIFETFMEMNNLYDLALSDLPDEEILKHFLKASLPPSLHKDLLTFLKYVKYPLAVRSSSKLEDSMYQPFAGIYSTYMIPASESELHRTLQSLTDAIKCVYASVFYKSSKAYMAATSNVIDEEKMGIILQEVCGTQYGNRFYPTLSGVARSLNFYPVKPEKSSDGIVTLGFGLGKYVVDGGTAIRFSPKHPKNILQLSSPIEALKNTQKTFYSLDLSPDSFIPTTDDSANLLKLKITEAEKDAGFQHVSSTYDFENNIIRDGFNHSGKKLITFSNILQYKTFPLVEILEAMLEISQKEMGSQVEIEFAANLDVPSEKSQLFNFLQIRPIVINDQRINFSLDSVPPEKSIIISNSALGNGRIDNLFDLVYIKPEAFKPSETKKIAGDLDKLNTKFIREKRNYILIGPGRWGSADPWLGIPIKWPQISEARIIVESGLQNYRIDPSQGTHFFQNLTTFRVGYFTVSPYANEGFYDPGFLNLQNAYYEDEFIRHVRFEVPLRTFIDGRKNKGVILKPGESLS
ncbi:MAG TPA: PEP/pyruvate-binding domain-containing protein [Bacteroidales bacterium]